jgi:hypothetical protein
LAAGISVILGAAAGGGAFVANGLVAHRAAPMRSAAPTSASRRATERTMAERAAHAPGIGIREISRTGGRGPVGARVTISYEVTNTGDMPLNSVIATDDRFGRVSCPQAELAPGEHMTCGVSHVLSAADLARGNLASTATVSAVTPAGHQVTGATEGGGLPPEVSVTG